MENTIKILQYQMKIDDKINGVVFNKDKSSYRGKTIDTIFKKETKERLMKEMTVKDLTYPVLLELGDHDYFIKEKTYTKKDGTEASKYILCITNYISAEQGEFTGGKTLDDFVEELLKPVTEE